jgi:hypothetical protein
MVVKLDALLRSQDEFVADASHQLRTPLTALRLRLENLAREEGTRSDELEPAIVEVERLSSLVDGLLTLARADRATSEPVALDVGAASPSGSRRGRRSRRSRRCGSRHRSKAGRSHPSRQGGSSRSSTTCSRTRSRSHRQAPSVDVAAARSGGGSRSRYAIADRE